VKVDKAYKEAYDHFSEYYETLTKKETEEYYYTVCACVPMGAGQARGFYDATADKLGIERKPIEKSPPIDWSNIPNIPDRVW